MQHFVNLVLKVGALVCFHMILFPHLTCTTQGLCDVVCGVKLGDFHLKTLYGAVISDRRMVPKRPGRTPLVKAPRCRENLLTCEGNHGRTHVLPRSCPGCWGPLTASVCTSQLCVLPSTLSPLQTLPQGEFWPWPPLPPGHMHTLQAGVQDSHLLANQVLGQP